jgi:hypothetical protein
MKEQTSPTMEPIILKEIRDSSIRIVIRLGLGEYRERGPHNNVLELESRVAWATVITELQNEGYIVVSPEEYAAVYGLTPADVIGMIEQDGNLFGLVYASAGKTFMAVPLAERKAQEQLGPIPE